SSATRRTDVTIANHGDMPGSLQRMVRPRCVNVHILQSKLVGHCPNHWSSGCEIMPARWSASAHNLVWRRTQAPIPSTTRCEPHSNPSKTPTAAPNQLEQIYREDGQSCPA